ncbi:MAG: FHA domain-containing protein, partial [Parachlamydiaceae bacterium]
MIKLTLTPYTQPIAYIFEKKSVIIGKVSDTGISPDIALSQSNLADIHVKIEFRDPHFIAFNVAGDPFTTLNELPFSKKILHNGDLLQIGSSLFQFEGYSHSEGEEMATEPMQSNKDTSLLEILTDKMESIYEKAPLPTYTPLPDEPFDLDAAMRDLEEMLLENSQHSSTDMILPSEYAVPTQNEKTQKSRLSDTEIEALLIEVSQLENDLNVVEAQVDLPEEKLHQTLEFTPTSQNHPIPVLVELSSQENADSKIPQIIERKKSIKDDFNSEQEDENFTPSKKLDTPIKSLINWNSFLTGITTFLLLILVVISCLYIAISDRNDEEEIKAAQAVADVAMALNFAQINQSYPQNQNWSDSDFLKHNLKAILAPSYPPLANVDTHGNLQNTSYILRIYTGKDLNHFLIIAQPRPSLLQWIKPKAAITVDSSFMELRKITDLKTLNRMLVNPTLDTSNSTSIAHLVNLGDLIPLVELKKYHPHSGFDLPKALAYAHPGAENFIYNAARYYPLGESLMKKAIALYESDDDGHGLMPLIDEIDRFTRFPNIVLYSSSGLQVAQKGQKALATFFPKYPFIHAYLQVDPHNFSVNSHLLMGEPIDGLISLDESSEDFKNMKKSKKSTKKASVLDSPVSSEKLLEFLEMLYMEEMGHTQKSIESNETSAIPKNAHSNNTEIDPNHPLYYKLIAIYKTREQKLKPINEKIDYEKSQHHLDSSKNLSALKIEYELTSKHWLKKSIKLISELQQEYASMPITQFMEYVKAAGMEPFVGEHLHKQLQSPKQISFSKDLVRSS